MDLMERFFIRVSEKDNPTPGQARIRVGDIVSYRPVMWKEQGENVREGIVLVGARDLIGCQILGTQRSWVVLESVEQVEAKIEQALAANATVVLMAPSVPPEPADLDSRVEERNEEPERGN